MLSKFPKNEKFPRGGMRISQQDRTEFDIETEEGKEEEEDEDTGNVIVATGSFLEGPRITKNIVRISLM